MSVILIVDDNEKNRYLLRTVLAASSYEIIEAANGAEALESARRTRPELIISDILMPQMDGFELCRECKSDEQLRNIPFVFYTATYTDPRDEALGLKLGAARFLVKPIEGEEFVSIVREVLKAHANNQLTAPLPPMEDNTVFYKLYNEALIRKLEDKMLELKSLNLNLTKSEERFRALTEATAEGIVFHNQGLIVDVNPPLVSMFGYENASEMIGHELLDFVASELRDFVVKQIQSENTQPYEAMGLRKDGTNFPVESSARLYNYQGRTVRVASIRDITERKKAEEERERLQSQLIQAHKMESIGRLAGGVAHDFNNMLSAILGYTELALDKTDPATPLHGYLKEIFNATKRSADLTRQLLAFARRQTISPKALDINETVESMLKMLRRLIGENIGLIWRPGSGIWPVILDTSQIDQILANLCVNARDAIVDVGKIIIETDTATFNEAYCAAHEGFVPGEYVLLAVSDNGCGMDKEMLSHVFEPFFTTKGVSKGTGLGLATVYGIVNQNNGFINVYSEPGSGTTFKIYLPRHKGKADKTITECASEIPQGCGEIVLLVEDEASILELGKKMLEKIGYTVLAAATPQEAFDLARTHNGKIHLLITDVVMPEMNGRDLADRLHSLYPDIKTLFMSGYPADVISHKGVLDEGVNFIQKPFLQKELAVKVCKTLGRK